MELKKRKVLTIVAEESLLHPLQERMEAYGLKGYTYWDCRGFGSHGHAKGSWEQDANVFIEVILKEEKVEAIVEDLFKEFSAHYRMIVYLRDIEVVRSEKFS